MLILWNTFIGQSGCQSKSVWSMLPFLAASHLTIEVPQVKLQTVRGEKSSRYVPVFSDMLCHPWPSSLKANLWVLFLKNLCVTLYMIWDTFRKHSNKSMLAWISPGYAKFSKMVVPKPKEKREVIKRGKIPLPLHLPCRSGVITNQVREVVPEVREWQQWYVKIAT